LPTNAKIDVYSYGVVLLELVTGSRISSGMAMDGEEVQLSQFVHALKELLVSGDLKDIEDIVDTRLNGHFDPEQVAVMVKLALSCLEERNRRPTMNEIVRALLDCDDHDSHPAYSRLTFDNLLNLDL
jgi:hypothetical protein